MVPSYRLIWVAFAAEAKVGIIPLIGLPFPGYPQGQRRKSSHMKIIVAAFALATCAFAASPAFAQAAPADTEDDLRLPEEGG